jgi:hypothetical protein
VAEETPEFGFTPLLPNVILGRGNQYKKCEGIAPEFDARRAAPLFL